MVFVAAIQAFKLGDVSRFDCIELPRAEAERSYSLCVWYEQMPLAMRPRPTSPLGLGLFTPTCCERLDNASKPEKLVDKPSVLGFYKAL